ncbi:MAG TPA: WD40 repeat domain-containing protein [Planctomycetaceae bacterium]|nr:WD40 repeat domain-containing protein [Planctomycetaceae bacterium]
MRRGSLRPHSRSAHRRGRIGFDYLREVVFISAIIAAVLVVQQSLRSNAATTSDHPHSDHPVYSMTLSHNGQRLWVSREAYGLSEIDLNDGTECEHSRLFDAEASYTSHGGMDRPLTLRFSFDRSLELLQGNTPVHGERLSEGFENISDSDVSSDGRTAVLVTSRGWIKIWNEQADSTFTSRELRVASTIDSVTLTRNGHRAVLLGDEMIVWLDLQTGAELARWRTSDGGATKKVLSGRPEAVALSPDEAHLALGFSNGLVRVWDCATKQIVWERFADQYKTSALAFSPSGLLASGGFDKGVRVWDWRTDTLRWERTYHTRASHDLAFAADESRLYSGGLDGKVIELDSITGELVRTLP